MGLAAVSDVEIFKAARAAGFTEDEAITMTAIAIAESRGLPDAIGDDGSSFGLWQIHSGVPFLGWNTALGNAMAARAKYLVQGFNAWCTYFPTGCNGAARGHSAEQQHTTYLARGRAAASGIEPEKDDGLIPDDINIPGPINPPNPLNALDPLLTWIADRAIIVFEVLAGLSLIALGLALLAFEGLL